MILNNGNVKSKLCFVINIVFIMINLAELSNPPTNCMKEMKHHQLHAARWSEGLTRLEKPVLL